MNKRLFFLSFFLCVAVSSFSQKSTIPDSILSKEIVIVDTAKIKTEEFLWFYNKYNSYLDSSLILSIDESLNYFIDYKMKIIEAERKQLDTSQNFKDEFYSYITTTANSYLFDTDYDEKYLQLEYERLKKDIKIQHIFIRSYKFSNPKDTLIAYEKALKIKNDIIAGKDFETLAKNLSEDTFTKENGGNLGYITATLLPFEYENAIYNAKIGDLLGPICTEQGYFITKILDSRKTKGVSRASIIVIYPESKDSLGWAKAKLTIDSVYNRLQLGEKFTSLSDIYNSNSKLKSKQGDIGWLDNSVKYETKLKEEIFSLQNIGDYSKPLEFEYGYVICYLSNKDTLPAYSVYSKVIAKSIKGDESRKNLAKKSFIKSYKSQTKYSENNANITEFISQVDNSVLIDKWEKPKIKSDKILFTFEDSTYTFSDFANYLVKNQKDKRISDKEILIRYRLQEYAEKMLEQHALQTLHLKNKEFAMVMQEYHDGMIIYELINNEVFQKSTSDTTALYKYYTENKNEYLKNEGVAVTYYMCKDDKVVKKLLPLIKKQQVEYFADQYIMTQLNKKEMDNVIRDTAIYYKGDNSYIDSLQWQKGNYHILKNNKVLVITDVIPVTPYAFEECKNQVISDYQNIIEQEWILNLRKKYTFTINTAVLNTLKEYFN